MTLAERSNDAPPVEMVTLTIDGNEVTVPKGTLVIRAAELIGVQIPRFCDHPLLDPVGACRQCLVEVEGQRKPMASCTITVAPEMVVRTQYTSEAADKAQQGVMELLLINHPLDCPVCDKGGECPLQNQAMSNGRPETRFEDVKRTFPKPISISSQVLLDRERCVLCARCTRFSDQIAGDRFIDLLERGALQQVGIAPGEPFQSYFSGNTVQICPVGALTGTAYRFRARPFDLVSSPSVCEHCASGCAQRTDHRRGKVLRRLAGDDPEVNEEWNCDKGRWAFTYATVGDRITTPLVRDDGALRPASWSEALGIAGAGLAAAVGSAGVLVGGRATAEEAYAYAKFARIVLGTNDIDFRTRPHSAEEADFLAAHVAGLPMTVTYSDLEKAPAVLLAGLEPEEESPILYLRLRKAVRRHGLQVLSVAPLATRSLGKLSGRLIRSAPGAEAAALDHLAGEELLAMPGSLLLVGERLATSPGALSAVARLAETTGARIAWVPRRAGDRGAVEAGAMPNLLPGGRPVGDAAARRQTARSWNVDDIPDVVGRDTSAILAAAREGALNALLIGGVELADLPDPDAALAAVDAAPFVVSLELRHSEVTERADVVFPVAPVVEKAGSFVNWEGRIRPFEAALRTNAVSDLRVLNFLADEIGVDLGVTTAAEERARLGLWAGDRAPSPRHDPAPNHPDSGQAVLAGWRMLLDDGRLQDGEPHLAGTARTPVARLSEATAAEIGVAGGEPLTVSTDRGAVTLPLELADMDDRVVWLPLNSPGCHVHRALGVTTGAVVSIGAGQHGQSGHGQHGQSGHGQHGQSGRSQHGQSGRSQHGQSGRSPR
ncbi:NADH-quinone oxidoreductase subunit G [Mycolicibacterium sp. jd]|uniref:NADH-quinone oxidoreductase subunit G n=1 Tax=unclassified Mycolicibacterium TaxID=2636767 RepID=UPI00351AE831